MMRPCPYPVSRLLPHAPPMILLDAVVGWQPGALDAQVTINPRSRFFQPGRGIPGHIIIEYMAQACGAYAGLEAVEADQPVRMGFLLGTRNFESSVAWIGAGTTLTVSVSEVLHQPPMAIFDCRVLLDGRPIATARLTVYQPESSPIQADMTMGAPS